MEIFFKRFLSSMVNFMFNTRLGNTTSVDWVVRPVLIG